MHLDRKLNETTIAVFQKAMKVCSPETLIARRLSFDGANLSAGNSTVRLADYKKIYVVAIGKAAAAMAAAVESLLGEKINNGYVLSNSFLSDLPEKYACYPCTHPHPSQQNISATKKVVTALAASEASDLVIFLISGGGSAMLCSPINGVSLDEKRNEIAGMINSGKSIAEINIRRKELSNVKGGKLAEIAAPARMLALYLSDVAGDDMATIASGPTVSQSVAVDNYLIGSNNDILQATKAVLEAEEINVVINEVQFTGAARELGEQLAEKARDLRQKAKRENKMQAYLAGGETTVEVTGNGKGGRNCELALAAAIGLDRLAGVSLLAVGTDGIDGPTDAAGAVACGQSISNYSGSLSEAIDLLNDNDSYSFFNDIGDLVITGPTGTNLMDIVLILADYRMEAGDE